MRREWFFTMYHMKITYGTEGYEDAAALRTEIFIKEQGFTQEFDEIDERAYHAIYYFDGIPVATGRVFWDKDEGGSYTIGRVCVKKEYRKQHLGSVIIEALMKVAEEKGASRVHLSSQLSARGFYESLGFTAYGPIYYDETCPHIAMEKVLK